MTAQHKDFSEHELVLAFRQAMAEHGLHTSDTIEPTNGAVARFHVDGDSKGTRNGWYVLFVDGGLPAGEFGSWKAGVSVTWCAKEARTMTPAEQQAVQKRIEAARAKREADKRQREGEAARTANLLWNDAQPADDSHPYLRRKGVPSHNLRITDWPVRNSKGEVFRHVKNTLLIPVLDARGRIISLQGIFPEKDAGFGRDKDFWKEGRKRGGYFMIGQPKAGGTIAVCEGYATGATIHAATGWCVLVAFDAGNLNAVAETMREALPDYTFVICADNDQWTTEPTNNPGVVFARQAAQGINARCLVPAFPNTDTKPTDWNDLARLEGMEECQRQLMEHTLPAPANDNAAAPGAVKRDVDTFTPLPFVGARGKPKSTHENLAEICERLNVVVRYNVISKEEEILIPDQEFGPDNAANASFGWLKSMCARFDMPTGDLSDFLPVLSSKNQYNPVANWITSKPWDGVKRLPALYDTVTPAADKRLADGRSLRDVLIMRWMLSAVAAAFQPDGVSAQGILVLQGDQYLGKTTWFKKLVPAELGVLKDGMILRPDDKDSVKQVCSFWLVELGELDATFRKSDIAALKSFITNQSDVLRRPYARKESHFARRTVFFGSVNPTSFLHDPTGNRRFWTIDALRIDLSHGLDMQQVWAEAYELWKGGEGHYLTADELAALNSHNEAFTVVDPIEERLQTRLDWEADKSRWEWKTSTEILISVGVDKPTQADATKAATVIRKLNGDLGKRAPGGRARLLLVPPKPLSRDDYDRPY